MPVASVVSPTMGNIAGTPKKGKTFIMVGAVTDYIQYLHQHINEMRTRNVLVTDPKTITSFLNISMASAPIQNTDAREKYCIRTDMMVQTMSY